MHHASPSYDAIFKCSGDHRAPEHSNEDERRQTAKDRHPNIPLRDPPNSRPRLPTRRDTSTHADAGQTAGASRDLGQPRPESSEREEAKQRKQTETSAAHQRPPPTDDTTTERGQTRKGKGDDNQDTEGTRGNEKANDRHERDKTRQPPSNGKARGGVRKRESQANQEPGERK